MAGKRRGHLLSGDNRTGTSGLHENSVYPWIGKEISPEELDGKTAIWKIRITYENHAKAYGKRKGRGRNSIQPDCSCDRIDPSK